MTSLPYKKRIGVISVLLTLLQPGLGHLYRGEIRKAYLFPLASYGLGICAFISGAPNTFGGFIATFIGIIFIFLWCLWDSSREQRASYILKWYNRWYFYLLFILLFWIPGEYLSNFLKAHFYEAFKVPAASMEPTLRSGDFILVNKNYYNANPIQRGDVIIFHLSDDPETPEDESLTKIVKRVVGLAGDTVEVRGREVYLNGERYPEEYVRWLEGGLPSGNFVPSKVPPNKLFLLGDNRDHSKDSRYWKEPFVSLDNVIGKVLYVYFSWRDWTRAGNVIR